MKRYIMTSEDIDENLDSSIDELKDNFDYAIDGLYKLARDGKEGTNKATQIALQLAEYVQNANEDIASSILGDKE